MQNQLFSTYVKEIDGAYEYGLVEHEAVGKDHLIRIGRSKSHTIATAHSRELIQRAYIASTLFMRTQ